MKKVYIKTSKGNVYLNVYETERDYKVFIEGFLKDNKDSQIINEEDLDDDEEIFSYLGISSKDIQPTIINFWCSKKLTVGDIKNIPAETLHKIISLVDINSEE